MQLKEVKFVPEWSASLLCRFTPREIARTTHWIAGWGGDSGRCGVEKNLLDLLGIEPRPTSPWPVPISTELSRLQKRNK
jgi:hypothetical protein